MNAKTFEKSEGSVQSILYRRAVSEFFEDNYWNWQDKSIVSSWQWHVKSSMKSLFEWEWKKWECHDRDDEFQLKQKKAFERRRHNAHASRQVEKFNHDRRKINQSLRKSDRCAQQGLQSLFRQSGIVEDDSRHIIDVRSEEIAKNINNDGQDSQSRRSFEILLNFQLRRHWE